MSWFKRRERHPDEVPDHEKQGPYKPKTELGRLEVWFAHNHRSTGFDLSATGFHNYLKSIGKA